MPDFERPTEIGEQRDVFDRFAERSSRMVGRPIFFVSALALVVIWMPLVSVFRSFDTWQLVLNTVTSVVAFLLIALLQNSERRNDRALQRKLDTIASALEVQLRHELAPDRESLRRTAEELGAAVRLEGRI